MLGFLKKKKKTDSDGADKKTGDKAQKKDNNEEKKDSETLDPDAKPAKKKKRLSIKKLIFIVLILGVLGGGGYFAYSYFFGASSSKSGPAPRVYNPVPLAHVNLPPEMLAFTFNQIPNLYDALVAFNGQMDLFEGEILRIEAVGTQYPEQKKIVDSQKKVWEKGKNTLLKAFTKLEKPIKETFVLYQVNKTRGLEQIQSKTKDLTATAQDALKVAREQTAELKDRLPKPPEGMVQGLLYKIKKIFQ